MGRWRLETANATEPNEQHRELQYNLGSPSVRLARPFRRNTR